MHRHLKRVSSLWLPVLLITIYLVLVYLLKDVLPSPDEIVNNFAKLFAKYGYEIVFFGAFLEAALMIGLLVPGSSVVLIGAYFASTGLLSYPVFLLVSAMGFFLGFFLDYLIGFYGWSAILDRFGWGNRLNNVRSRVERLGGKSFFLGYAHPASASIFALTSGIIKMEIGHFTLYSLLAGSVWLVFWTGLVYVLGTATQAFFENSAIYIIFVLLTLIFIASMFNFKKN